VKNGGAPVITTVTTTTSDALRKKYVQLVIMGWCWKKKPHLIDSLSLISRVFLPAPPIFLPVPSSFSYFSY